MDRWTKLEGEGRSPVSKAIALLSRRRPAGTPGASPASLRKGQHTGQTVEETMPPRRRANKTQLVQFCEGGRREQVERAAA